MKLSKLTAFNAFLRGKLRALNTYRLRLTSKGLRTEVFMVLEYFYSKFAAFWREPKSTCFMHILYRDPQDNSMWYFKWFFPWNKVHIWWIIKAQMSPALSPRGQSVVVWYHCHSWLCNCMLSTHNCCFTFIPAQGISHKKIINTIGRPSGPEASPVSPYDCQAIQPTAAVTLALGGYAWVKGIWFLLMEH